MALSSDEEQIASDYRRMLKMGMPEGAVMQKMNIDGVAQNIQGAVLAGNSGVEEEKIEETPSEVFDVSEPDNDQQERHYEPMNPNSHSSYVEEIVDTDDEEIIIDEEEVFDEEEVLEEEVVEAEDVQQDGAQQDQQQVIEGDQTLESTDNGSTYRSTVVNDIEQQEHQKADVPPPEQAPPVKTKSPEKPRPSPSSLWYWISCLLLVAMLGTAGGVGYWLTTRDGGNIPIIEDEQDFQTAAPSPTVSTRFDPIQGGDCSFSGVPNPSPIDQCNCDGRIHTIASDIESRYEYNREVFISMYYEDYKDDISSCSPRNQALVWISSGDDATSSEEDRAQRYALATIFAGLGGAAWNDRTNWLSYRDFCAWEGIECDSRGMVTTLTLADNNLIGEIPPEIVFLEDLQGLNLARNEIYGPLPLSLFTIPSILDVDVSFNNLTGVIPPTVGEAESLNSLNVENNKMTGRLTANIGNAQSLTLLNLNSNQYQGDLPVELFRLSRLSDLNIGNNQFFGTIPADISMLSGLNRLTLGPNLFTGAIQSTITSLTNLNYLSIQGIELTGRLPASIGFLLTNLTDLIISNTNIEGNIDTSFGRLRNLQILDLSGNQLNGAIPSQFGYLQNLVALGLDNNFLAGQIPVSLGSITTLQELRLNNNLLEGVIPSSFGNLISLEVLRLEANRLQDRVAEAICALRQDELNEFVVDCPLDIGGETFGVVCAIPECCTSCVPLVG